MNYSELIERLRKETPDYCPSEAADAIVSKWWDSGMEALNEYQQLKPGAKEEAEAWAKMRKVTP